MSLISPDDECATDGCVNKAVDGNDYCPRCREEQ